MCTALMKEHPEFWWVLHLSERRNLVLYFTLQSWALDSSMLSFYTIQLWLPLPLATLLSVVRTRFKGCWLHSFNCCLPNVLLVGSPVAWWIQVLAFCWYIDLQEVFAILTQVVTLSWMNANRHEKIAQPPLWLVYTNGHLFVRLYRYFRSCHHHGYTQGCNCGIMLGYSKHRWYWIPREPLQRVVLSVVWWSKL